jgi:hypothetical protein
MSTNRGPQQKDSIVIRQNKWMQYLEAEDRTGMGPDALRKLVHDGGIRTKPWYLPPFSVDLLRRVDVRKYEKPPAHTA